VEAILFSIAGVVCQESSGFFEICFLMTMRDATARGKRRPAARLSDYAAGEN
jgi:hypothetical protein